MKTAYHNGIKLQMEFSRLFDFMRHNGLNVIVNHSNGYSHDWQMSEHPNLDNTKPDVIYLTDKPVGYIPNSSVVSFS